MESDKSLNYGRYLASPPPGEEVVISGMAGYFARSDNFYELRDNLFNHVDMVTEDERPLAKEHPKIPKRMGKIKKVSKFDASFFGVHSEQANVMSGTVRIILERTYEAIVDAGINPFSLRGSRTGVYVGNSLNETERAVFHDQVDDHGFAFTCCSRTALSCRVSYWLGLKGPSYSVDTACSSALYSFYNAYEDMRNGIIDYAIVAGTHLCLNPYVSVEFSLLSVLSPEGITKVFDHNADGYTRAEAIGVFFLQRAKTAKRIYATVVHSKVNCDGYKPQSITYPSREMQAELLKECYEESGIDPASVDYVEAHGTSTRAGDPEEVYALERVFCTGRDLPLPIGSCKSNMGHSEPASYSCSLAKVLLSMESGMIPANLHYKTPRDDIPEIQSGKIKVVAENMPWNGGLVGINSFGFGGTNGHAVLRSHKKEKTNGGVPSDCIPRLVLASGRTEEAVQAILDDVESRAVDIEFISLLHDLHSTNIPGHMYRGYSLLAPGSQKTREIKFYGRSQHPVWFIFSGLGSEWPGMGKSLLHIPVFAESIDKCNQVLKQFDIDIRNIISTDDINIFKNSFNAGLGIIAMQIGLVDLLHHIGIVADGLLGQTTGELCCAYVDGALTLEQVILITYYYGMVVSEKSKLSVLHEKLLGYLKEVIGSPKARISSSAVEPAWNSQEAKLVSAEYFMNCLLGSMEFKESFCYIPENAITIEIAPFGILQNLLANSLNPKTARLACLPEKGCNAMEQLLISVGRLYEVGLQPQLSKLYPAVQYPVSRGTPMISPLIRWEHSKDWFVYPEAHENKNTSERLMEIDVMAKENNFYTGHVIDGRNLFPATGYIVLAWEMFCRVNALGLKSVVLENIRFNRATTLPIQGTVQFVVSVQKSSGRFEVVESGIAIVTGYIRYLEDPSKGTMLKLKLPKSSQGQDLMDLSSRDIYKELRLRGYNYTGAFRSLVSVDNMGTSGKILWTENWVGFMDSMLQMRILPKDTRNLYVPTVIDKIVIDMEKHNEDLAHCETESVLPIYAWNDMDIVCAGGVEIQRLKANAITKRRALGEPVLERYHFVPHFADANPPLNLQQVVKICVHVTLENHHSTVVKAVELVDENSDPNAELLAPQFVDILADLPLITPSLWVLGSEDNTRLSELGPEVQFLSSGLSSDHSALLVVGSNLLSRLEVLKSALQALTDNGCIITRETNVVNLSTIGLNLQVLVDQIVDSERILLLKKVLQCVLPVVIHITEKNFSWLSGLKTALKSTTPPQRVVLVAQGEPLNGILGLYKCIQKEPGAELARCFFILDEKAPSFDPELPFYHEQLDKDLAVNVYHNAQWGSYRHLLLDSLPTVPAAHAYNNVLVQGDLSTLSWLEGPLDPYKREEDLIYIYYSSLNFRDIMLSTGKISTDVATKDRTKQEILQGFEFSGRDSMGRRVMGLEAAGTLGTLLKVKSKLVWEVPEHWTLEEAATVPCVYTTVIFALSVRGHMQRGETVLIHAGTGGIGLAAITYCLHHGCTVFTTVGTKEKREFINHQFPQLTDRHIGNSRDTSFEDLIMRETNGRGVDIVLNSLSEEKLHASIRCLAQFGRFLEIGKFDMSKNNLLGMEMFSRGQSFSSVMLDLAFTGGEELCQSLHRILEDGIREGSVQPLNRTVYPTSKVEEAFRFMAAAKHMGKILIQIRPEEEDKQIIPKHVVMNVKPRFHCIPDLSYIILGGLGGFGLELADWLVLRGARKLVLTSRKGITTGYQSFRIRIWRSYNTVVHISTADISTEDGVRKLLQESNSIAPVGGIFNLAVVLHDALLESQTEQKFEESAKGKAIATRYLDKMSREMCPDLKQFVVFSSVSCGRGNAGQSNYGMSNSVMERVCEARVRDGLPGLAVQWGAIGDVGLVAEMQEEQHELVIGGTLQQKITSCLATLDNFLKQPHPVVSSMVVAEKRTGGTGGSSIVDAITNILGLHDLKTVSTLSTLTELGMDSMMAVEIKQVLEREFELSFTPQEIRMLTIARLQELDGEKGGGEYLMENEMQDDTRQEERNFVARIIKGSKVASITCYPLPSLCTETCTHTIFMLPGIEGLASVFEPLCRSLTARCVGLQLGYDNPANSIPDMATYLLPHIKRERTRGSSVSLLGHSLGGILALELAAALRAHGWQGQVILLDSSPLFIKTLLQEHILKNSSKEENVHLLILWQILKILDFSQEHDFKKFSADICNLKSWNDRLEMLLNMTLTDEHSHEYQRIVANGILTRVNAIMNYKTHKCVVDAPVVLVRTKESTAQIGDDYGLREICRANVAVHHCEGDHFSILDHPTTAEVINATLMDVPV